MRPHPITPLERTVVAACLAYDRAKDRALATPRTSPAYASAWSVLVAAERAAVAALRDLPGGGRGDTLPFKAGERSYWLDATDRLYSRPFVGFVSQLPVGPPATARALQRRAQRARIKRDAQQDRGASV